jgi:hypothetical protein
MNVVKRVDGDYSSWERSVAGRYPLALAEMRQPSAPLGTPEAMALARWGIECHPGWRCLIEHLLDQLEAAIAEQPEHRRPDLGIVQMKEKFGRLTVYLASEGSPAMKAAIEAAGEQSIRTCEICSEPGQLVERRGWWTARCSGHENWSPHERLI